MLFTEMTTRNLSGMGKNQCKVQRHGVSLTFTQHANGTFMIQGKSIDFWREEHFPKLELLFANPPWESLEPEANTKSTADNNKPTSCNNNITILSRNSDGNRNCHQ